MADIFSTEAGRVAALSQGNSLPFQLVFDGWGGYYAFKAITTNLGISGMGGHQFMHTLQDQIYVYVFNERIGQLQIGGLAFAGICEAEDGVAGIEFVQDYYDLNRITTRPTTVTVTIGNTFSIAAFLIGVQHNIVDPSTKVDQFQLKFAWVPRTFTGDIPDADGSPILNLNASVPGLPGVGPDGGSLGGLPGIPFGSGAGNGSQNTPANEPY